MSHSDAYAGFKLRLARTALRLGVREAALGIDISPETITRIEKNCGVKVSTINRARAFFEERGIIFVDDPNKPGVMLDLDRSTSVES